MKLEEISCKGSDDKPAVIFIHGLGMDRNIWVDPSASRILGGLFPLSILLGGNRKKRTERISTLFDDLQSRDYNLVTWSQRRPAGPIESAVQELREIAKIARTMTRSGLILVCHSRGGLVARKYLTEEDNSVKGIITISTPHYGSSVARVAAYVTPLARALDPLFPSGEKGSLAFAVKRVSEFLKSRSLKELLPGSNFFRTLHDRRLKGVWYISLGGTSPTLFRIRKFSFPDVFERVIPEKYFPDEMKKGRGDGLVSSESSRLSWADEHFTFDHNHASILFDPEVRKLLCRIIEKEF